MSLFPPERAAELAHEIAAAVFRVSALVCHRRLRFELEGEAVELTKEPSPDGTGKLSRLVRLAEAIGEMSPVNAEVLQRELGNLQKVLNAEITESTVKAVHSIDLQRIFVGKIGQEETEIISQDDRQVAILQYIRKFPYGCRMRQLSVAFAGVSERTIRADIGRLIAKGLVEKVGSKTGPFSYFRARSPSKTLVTREGSPAL